MDLIRSFDIPKSTNIAGWFERMASSLAKFSDTFSKAIWPFPTEMLAHCRAHFLSPGLGLGFGFGCCAGLPCPGFWGC
jgi:hypothetical protein